MKKSHEQTIIDLFFDHFRKKAGKEGKNIIRCSMDGQDSIVGADYLFTDNTKFILTEFKYEEANLKSERKKESRLKLCCLLDSESNKAQQSLACHYIAWSQKEQNMRSVFFNQYKLEICNKEIFGEQSVLIESQPKKKTRKKADEMIDEFLGQQLGSEYNVFKEYIDWLLNISDSTASEIEILVNDPDADNLRIFDFNSLQELKTWLNNVSLKREIDFKSDGGMNFGP